MKKKILSVEEIGSVEIIPLEKAVINDMTLSLGMRREEVNDLIGEGELARDCYYYFESEMSITYDDSDCIEFIEFLGGVDGKMQPVIYGIPVFQTEARELVKVIEKHNSGLAYFECGIEDFDSDHDIEFYNMSVGLYREMTPADIDEMISEMKAEGISVEENEDLENDIRKSQYWATIGIGVEGYYNK